MIFDFTIESVQLSPATIESIDEEQQLPVNSHRVETVQSNANGDILPMDQPRMDGTDPSLDAGDMDSDGSSLP